MMFKGPTEVETRSDWLKKVSVKGIILEPIISSFKGGLGIYLKI